MIPKTKRVYLYCELTGLTYYKVVDVNTLVKPQNGYFYDEETTNIN